MISAIRSGWQVDTDYSTPEHGAYQPDIRFGRSQSVVADGRAQQPAAWSA